MDHLTVERMRPMKTAPLVLAALAPVALAIAGGAVALDRRGAALAREEWQRAAALLEATREGEPTCRFAHVLARKGCVQQDFEDLDRDGFVDCWREHHDDAAAAQPTRLTVWPACRDGARVVFDVAPTGASLLVVPPSLATDVWLSWISRRFLGPEAVACDRVAGCRSPGPEWRWTVASAEREHAMPGLHGRAVLVDDWQVRGRPEAGVLVLRSVDDGWMEVRRGADAPIATPSGPRIIVERGRGSRTRAIPCGGFEVHAEPRGLVATRGDGEWRWLFRGPPDFGGFDAKVMTCVDGVVFASEGTSHADVVAVDTRSGGWLFEPATDAGPGAELVLGGSLPMWRRDDGTVLSVATLTRWLRTPVSHRIPLADLARLERPELGSREARHLAWLMGVTRWEANTWQDASDEHEAPREEVPDEVRARLVPHGACGGWRISASSTAILAERGETARWIAVVADRSTESYTHVGCERGEVRVTAIDGSDRFVEPVGRRIESTIVIDLARPRWRVHDRAPQ